MKTLQAQPNLTASQIDLIYRSKVKASDRPHVGNSKRAYEIFMADWDMDKIEFIEQFKVMFLTRANKVLGIYQVSQGGMSSVIVDPKLIFTCALLTKASSLILCHNHPSCMLVPGDSDVSLTRKIKDIGRLLELPLVDHLIVTPDGYYSFADKNTL